VESASYVGLSRQVALQRELDVIANNVANMNTTGFRSEQVVFEEYMNSPGRRRAESGLSLVHDRTAWHDFTPGPAVTTNNPLDVAIDGDGFFAVQTAAGERYTRNGAFQINVRGELVTSEGSRVLGTGGALTFQPEDGEVTIGRDGTVATKDGVRGKLRLVRFANAQTLEKDGASTFKANEPPAAVADGQVRLVQGAVEKSNVRAVVEVNRLLEVTRSYTQLATMLSRNDDLRRSAIERLAEVPA
jgi:flagellar basal-body rod protein FlgF